MTYSVKEIYFTLQGEGAQTGRPAVFLRFAGCNLWSGREQDRAAAVCNFCDTDFDQDCTTGFVDLNIFSSWFFSSAPLFDFDGDGTVGFVDLNIFSSAFFGAPGPSAAGDCN